MQLDLSDTKTVGLISGTVFLVIYLLVKLFKQQPSSITLGDCLASLLGGSGTIAGFHLCILSLAKFVCENGDMEQNRVYVFIGGAAVAIISISSFWKRL